ncbi:efflux RND transporter periplasmic adaptor subunit [Pararhizobium sp. A13]|uniref:efflux RND transporter periplasmic adaptor subunit n=1 Tax=Pararhizobium sp. A13 TaxID=3133975 RepID=UPI00311B3916
MNTHLNLGTEHDRKLAQTLKSLSLEAVAHDIEPPKPMLRRLVLLASLAALISATALGIVFYRPDVVRHIDTIVTALPNPANTTADSVPVPGEVKLPQGERNVEQSAIRNPIPVSREITGSGFVVAPRMTTVFSKYEGKITNIVVEAGDRVEAGQVLVMLDDAGARFALEQAKATKAAADLVLAARTIDLAQARSSLDRTETLVARNAASRQQFEDARTAAERASNAVAQAKQELASAELSIRIAEEQLDELTVRAPFAGTVTRLDAHVGDTLLARVDSVRESQSLLTITDATRLMIDADVAETNIAALRPGLHGEAVLDAFPDRPFAVAVLRLAAVASAEKGTVTLRLSLSDPPEGIRPNMAARIRIALNEAGETTR